MRWLQQQPQGARHCTTAWTACHGSGSCGPQTRSNRSRCCNSSLKPWRPRSSAACRSSPGSSAPDSESSLPCYLHLRKAVSFTHSMVALPNGRTFAHRRASSRPSSPLPAAGGAAAPGARRLSAGTAAGQPAERSSGRAAPAEAASAVEDQAHCVATAAAAAPEEAAAKANRTGGGRLAPPHARAESKVCGSGSSGSRLARLAAPPVERWARCEAERQQRESAALQPCSFRPKTAKHTGDFWLASRIAQLSWELPSRALVAGS